MNEILIMSGTSPIIETFLIIKEDHKQLIYPVLTVEKLDILVENALHLDNQGQIVTYNMKSIEMFIWLINIMMNMITKQKKKKSMKFI